ncbi:MAG: hypothetical protein RDV48_14420 [Candidatus Eremiobacteraeota bacterium]|nr:hypothetical protein [Candidatus Eremiobacteraeota bacterium]
MAKHIFFALLAVSLALQGCGGSGESAVSVNPPAQGSTTRYTADAGFIELAPVSFSFQKTGTKLDFTSSRARMFYDFHPADEAPEGKPLFVFYNGGPGSATASDLLSYNTAPMTLDSAVTGSAGIAACPTSWTRLGNLLHIDARMTGFSYDLIADPSSEAARQSEFDAQNFNCYFDGADFIRVILRFLSSHPEIQKNPVVLVGESYGGVRTCVVLHILLNYRDYGNGKEIYQDPGLVDEIQAHYNKVFPSLSGQQVPPSTIAQQFGRQVLIEPLITSYQFDVSGEYFQMPDSIMYQLATWTGTTFVPVSSQNPGDAFNNGISFIDGTAQRDMYIYTKERDWLRNRQLSAEDRFLYVDVLSTLTGIDARSITGLYASDRAQAFKVISVQDQQKSSLDGGLLTADYLPEKTRLRQNTLSRINARWTSRAAGDMESVFGSLTAWDRYFISLNNQINSAFYQNQATAAGFDIDPEEPRWGRMFLKNAAVVKSFVTDAALDVIIYSDATPKALGMYPEIITSSVYDNTPKTGVERPGWIILTYRAGVFAEFPDLTTRTIRFPPYSQSCHSVPVTQPSEILSDVTKWLTSDE